VKILNRIVLTIIGAVAALFVISAGDLLISAVQLTLSVRLLLSLLVVALAATALHTGAVPAELARSVLRGGLALGVIGFSLGFFGPMLLMPDSNQGPLLGILITGPLGFLSGAVSGAVYWFVRRRRASRMPSTDVG
jgi:hypothetical protein